MESPGNGAPQQVENIEFVPANGMVPEAVTHKM